MPTTKTRRPATASIARPPKTVGELRSLMDALDGDGQFTYGTRRASIVRDNRRRAGLAAVALMAYGDRCFGGNPDGEDFDTVLGDLLSDLMHLCDLLGLDFDDMAERARMHYVPELFGTL